MRTCRAACPRSLLRPRPAPGARLSGPRGQGRGVPPALTAPAAGAESARPALPCPRAAALMRASPGAGDPAAQECVPTVPRAPDRGGRRHEGASRAHIRQRARGAAGASGRAVLGPARLVSWPGALRWAWCRRSPVRARASGGAAMRGGRHGAGAHARGARADRTGLAGWPTPKASPAPHAARAQGRPGGQGTRLWSGLRHGGGRRGCEEAAGGAGQGREGRA